MLFFSPSAEKASGLNCVIAKTLEKNKSKTSDFRNMRFVIDFKCTYFSKTEKLTFIRTEAPNFDLSSDKCMS